jgi:hypothetical protein
MKESNMPRADFVVSIVLLVFGIAVTWHSLQMPRFEDQGGTFLDSPGIVPAGLGILIALFAFQVLVRSIGQKGYRLGLNGRTVGAALRDIRSVRMLVTIGLCLVYAFVLLPLLRFIPSTLVFVFAFIMVFDYDPKKSLAAQWKVPVFALVIAAAATAAVYAAFTYAFLVNLP